MPIDTIVHGSILEITINRPAAMNALDAAANEDLKEVWKDFAANPKLQVAILTGAGDKAFCAGADLKSLIPAYHEASRRGGVADWNFGGGLARGLDIPKPIIAAINGHCIAGGLEIALACDVRICTPNAKLGLAEVKWGIIPGAGGTQRLPRAAPLSWALEMILTGDPITADEAFRIGLVNRVVPTEALLASAKALAERIASGGPLAVRAAKQAVYYGLGRDFGEGMAFEHILFKRIVATEDASEGPLAFAERRLPRFKGR
jgi:enoyl-CoA hydratase/carnithine racemase